MNELIIDTNVFIVAGGKGENISPMCKTACIRFLAENHETTRLLLDRAGEIRKEYATYMLEKKPLGLAMQFYLAMIRNPHYVDLHKNDEGFEDFPNDPRLVAFDKGDKKYVALAAKANKPITTALDARSWVKYYDELLDNNIHLTLLCGRDSAKWFTPEPHP